MLHWRIEAKIKKHLPTRWTKTTRLRVARPHHMELVEGAFDQKWIATYVKRQHLLPLSTNYQGELAEASAHWMNSRTFINQTGTWIYEYKNFYEISAGTLKGLHCFSAKRTFRQVYYIQSSRGKILRRTVCDWIWESRYFQNEYWHLAEVRFKLKTRRLHKCLLCWLGVMPQWILWLSPFVAMGRGFYAL